MPDFIVMDGLIHYITLFVMDVNTYPCPNLNADLFNISLSELVRPRVADERDINSSDS